MKQLIKLLLLFIAAMIISPVKSAQAADLAIVCHADGCSHPDTVLFNNLNVAPGQSISKTIEIKNNLTQTLNLDLTAAKSSETDDDFLDKINVSLDEVGFVNRFSGSLNDFFTSTIDLGSLNAGQTKSIIITLTLQDVGNEYQGKQSKFDLTVAINQQASAVSGGEETQEETQEPTKSISKILGISVPSAGAGQITEADTLAESGQIKGESYFRWWFWLIPAPLVLFSWLLYRRPRVR